MGSYPKGHIMCDPTDINVQKRQIHTDRKETSHCGLEEGRVTAKGCGVSFRGNEDTLE